MIGRKDIDRIDDRQQARVEQRKATRHPHVFGQHGAGPQRRLQLNERRNERIGAERAVDVQQFGLGRRQRADFVQKRGVRRRALPLERRQHVRTLVQSVANLPVALTIDDVAVHGRERAQRASSMACGDRGDTTSTIR